jgi:hypothetical protein
MMTMRGVLSLALLGAACATAQSSGFVLGVNYSEPMSGFTNQIATDSSGAVYVLSPYCAGDVSACVAKLSADGQTILWQNQLGFEVNGFELNGMAVDPNGGVYVMPRSQSGDTSIYVAKLGASGAGMAWTTSTGVVASPLGYPPFLAADSQGRAYVAAATDPADNVTQVARLNEAGSAVDYTAHVTGIPTAIAADSSGAAFVAGYTVNESTVTGFLARLAPDGSAGFYSTLPQDNAPAAVAIDANGNALVLGSNGVLQRVDSTGAVTLLTSIPGMTEGALALDAAGNAYITGIASRASQVKNSLATCGNVPEFLAVFAPDGALLQATYIPGVQGSTNPQPPALATGPNSTVYVLATAGPSFAPTQAGPFSPPAGTVPSFLLGLSPNASAGITPLACLANAASLQTGAISPGELSRCLAPGSGPSRGFSRGRPCKAPTPSRRPAWR